MGTCSYKNCAKPLYAKGLCGKHYQRQRLHGTPAGTARNHAPPDERFWRGVERGSPDECWIYQRGPKRGRYGRFQVGGKGSPHIGAHRYSYQLHKSPIPDGMVVMHKCDTPRCVNPNHLMIGTPKQNTADMLRKGRHARQAPLGAENGKSRLTEAQARLIKGSAKTNAELARQLKVSPSCVRSVRIGRTWKHL